MRGGTWKPFIFRLMKLFGGNKKQDIISKSDSVSPVLPEGVELLGKDVWYSKNVDLVSDSFSYEYGSPSMLLDLAFGKNSYVYSVVDDISKTASLLPRKLVDESGEEVGISDQFINRVLKKPNSKQTFNTFYKKILANLLVCGNVYIRRIQVEGFPRPFFVVLHTPCVKIETLNGRIDGVVSHYQYDQATRIEAQDVLHIQFDNIVRSTNYGMSPLAAGRLVYEGANDAFEAKAYMHKNRGAAGLLSPKEAGMPLQPKEENKLSSWLRHIIGGAKNANSIKVASTAMDYVQFGMSPTDLKSLEALVSDLRSICSVYGVDSARYNDPANSTYNNRQEAKEQFYRDVVLPLSKWVDQELSEFIFLDTFGIDAQFEVDKSEIQILNRPDLDRSRMIIEQKKAGIIPVSFAQELLYPSVDFSEYEDPVDDQPIQPIVGNENED